MVQARPKQMTAHAHRLLDVVRAGKSVTDRWNDEHRLTGGMYLPADEWLNRTLIAYGMGKKRLTPYDIALLEMLGEQGLIEAHDPGDRRNDVWMYRAKQSTE